MPDLETLLPDLSSPPPTRPGPRSSTRASPPASRRRAALEAPADRRRATHLLALGAVATSRASRSCVVIVVVVDRAPAAATTAASGGSAATASRPGRARRRRRAPRRREALDRRSARAGARAGPGAAAAAPRSRRSRRAVERTPTLTLSHHADEVEAVTDRAIRDVDGARRLRAELRGRHRSGSAASATLALQIPSAKLDDGARRSSKLANVKLALAADQDLTDQRRVARGRACATRAPTARACASGSPRRRPTGALAAARALDRATRRVTRASARSTSSPRVAYATVELAITATAAPAPPRRPAAAGRRATRWATPCACSRSIAGVLADRARGCCSRSPRSPSWRRSRAAILVRAAGASGRSRWRERPEW